MKKGISSLALGRIASFTAKHAVVNDQLPGGYGDESLPSDHCLKQIFKGIQVEMEHTDDPDLALEIALDHLVEFPDYYSRLSDMEDEAKSEESMEKDGPGELFNIDELLGKMKDRRDPEDIEVTASPDTQESFSDLPSFGRHPRG